MEEDRKVVCRKGRSAKGEMSDRRERNDKRNGGREEGLQGMTLQEGRKERKGEMLKGVKRGRREEWKKGKRDEGGNRSEVKRKNGRNRKRERGKEER